LTFFVISVIFGRISMAVPSFIDVFLKIQCNS
jgi:hypothetical protein